ncbi:MAG: hypothetical protein JNJ59_16625 [Deltaproteobacteria bacterium]|jgi:hypothetical protein|nr:hypothetical protein [Deltaproteobacteria bacterium]
MSLSPELAAFAAGPAEIARAKTLSYDRPAGLALVKDLTDRKLRSHLEALGEVSADKEVKKAARAAAYKLKSAGVEGGVQREAAVDLTVKIETENIAATTTPGFDGRLWLIVPTLPGHGGGDLDLRETGERLRAEPVDDLSIGRIRRFVAEVTKERPQQPPLLIGLDLAARLVGIADTCITLAGTRVPPTFAHFRSWQKRAVALGADPERASARAALGTFSQPVQDELVQALAVHPRLSFLSAPAAAFDAIDKEFRALLHGHEAIEKDAFLAAGKGLVEIAAKMWWDSPHGRTVAAKWLEATADVLWSEGDNDHARIALAAADDLLKWAGSALEHPLVARAFKGAVDLEAAWLHREAHMRGDAHHGHDHG